MYSRANILFYTKKKIIFSLMISILVFISCKKENQQKNQYQDDIEEVRDPKTIVKKKMRTTPEAIAYANGFDNWKNISEIKFTFNIDRDTTHYERSWLWKPQKQEITLTTMQDTTTYTKNSIDSTSIKTDQQFINDIYWLLAPYHLIWNKNHYSFSWQAKETAPISNKQMQKLTIVYDDTGYTPGDAYDFYFEGDFIIKEWVFRKKNSSIPSLITTWENYQNFDGIKISTMHNKKDNHWKLYFTNIEVTAQKTL